MQHSSNNIKNVRLIDSSNKEYRAFCKDKIIQKNTNSKEKIPDKKMFVGRWLEIVVNSQIMQYQALDTRRVIRWESLSPTGRVNPHYKEVDGLITLPNNSVLLF